ncbi:GTPase-activating protein [Shewanella sp. OPT22]|nr:GTPase-activating protein [Shewanella sp. OPT22]
MARSKKTRKVNENAPKHAPRTKKADRQVIGKKRNNGKKPGSRQNESQLKSDSRVAGTPKDPRHGSKKAISLTVEAPKKVASSPKPKQPKIDDQQRLLQLEEDPRLNQLLDQLEEGRVLAAEDEKWLNTQLDEMERLMDKLGLTAEDDIKPAPTDKDEQLLQQFESGESALDMYRQD